MGLFPCRIKNARQHPQAQQPVTGTVNANPQPSAGSSNDHLLELGVPFSNPQIELHAWTTSSFPTIDPARGVRPNMAVVSVDEPPYGVDFDAMQICSECDEGEATRICPAYRCLGNQQYTPGKGPSDITVISHVTSQYHVHTKRDIALISKVILGDEYRAQK